MCHRWLFILLLILPSWLFAQNGGDASKKDFFAIAHQDDYGQYEKQKQIVIAYINLTEEYFYTDPILALSFADTATVLGNKWNIPIAVAMAANLAGKIYAVQSLYTKALEKHLYSLELATELKLENPKYAKVEIWNCLDAADIYLQLDQPNKSLELLKRAEQVLAQRTNPSLNDTLSKADVFQNLGMVYLEQGKLDSALHMFELANPLYHYVGNPAGISNNLKELGNVMMLEGNFETALRFYQQALDINENNENNRGLADTYLKMAQIQDSLNNYGLAERHYKDAFEHAKTYSFSDTWQEAAEGLGRLLGQREEWQEAAYYFQESNRLKDTIFNLDRLKKANATDFAYRLREKEKELKDAKTQTELKAQALEKEQQVTYLLWALLVVAFGFSAYLIFLYKQRNKAFKELEAKNDLIQQKNEEIVQQNDKLEELSRKFYNKNQETESSLEYASRIQKGVLPEQKTIANGLGDCFILFKPRQIVSGDFYYWKETEEVKILAVADCTGHGVPGALTAVRCEAVLNRMVEKHYDTSPANILKKTHKNVSKALRQGDIHNPEGMDIGVIKWDVKENVVSYSGAKFNLICVVDGMVKRFDGGNLPVARLAYKSDERSYPVHDIPMELVQNGTFYLFSDGYKDQFDEDFTKRIGSKRFYNLLMDIYEKPLQVQQHILEETFQEWKGNNEQTDDVLVVGWRFGIGQHSELQEISKAQAE